MIKFKSITSRIIVSAIPVMAVSTMLFISVIYIVTHRQTNANINDKMIEMVKAASQDIEMELARNSDITSSMAIYAANVSTNFLMAPEFRQFVLKSIDSNTNTVGGGIWFEPYIIDENEKFFSAYAYRDNNKTVVTMDYADHVDYFGEIWYLDGKKSKGEVVWSDIYYDPVANVTMVTATQPFYDAEGKMLGVTTADMALTDIQKIIKQLKFGKTGVSFIVGNNGEYISYLDGSRGVSDKIQDDEDAELAALGKEIRKNNSGSAKLNLNGVEQSVYYNELPLGWTLVLMINTAEIRSSIMNLVLIMGIVPIVGLVLAIICILLVARHIKKVVGKVNTFADMAASGDLSKRINVIEEDEFGVMEDRLNKMIVNMSEMSKKNEEMLHIAQEASKSKSDFLSRMSHEIRTPMNAIIGMTEIALESENVIKIKDCLVKSQNASTHLLALINDILDMAKIEANKLEIYKKEFDMRKKLRNVFDLMEVRASEKKLSFSINISPIVPQFVISDELRFSQVLQNLIGNSIKFTPENGSVIIVVEAESCGDSEDMYVVTHIKDSGIGMSDETIAKLFESFEQADGGIARKYGGTGLGLAISKSLVEMMGGKLWVTSELGKGSDFSFSVLVQKSEGKSVAVEETISDIIPDLTDKVILLAEDIAINREIVKAMLAKTNVTIEDAENGVDAVEKFRTSEGRYNLILMDMQMPEMDGLEATKIIRAMPFGKDVPIIALTANAFQSDIDQAIASGMNGHIAKPIDRKELIKQVASRSR